MTVSRDAAGAYVVGRKTVSALCVVALLTTLGACAAENATGARDVGGVDRRCSGGRDRHCSGRPGTAAAAAPATTTAAAPKAAPKVLSPTEINEQCWMSSEVNKMKDLDAKAKYVDKCVAEKMKAQGM